MHGRGRRVCAPKDFLDLGSRQAIDQALSRLVVKSGQACRIGRDFYDWPGVGDVLKRPAPADLDAAVAAIARRDGIRIPPDGTIAARRPGLTNAASAKDLLHNGPDLPGWAPPVARDIASDRAATA